MKLKDEPANKPVFTTRFVLRNNSPITYVSFDEDGDWQFFSNDDFSEDDAMLVSVAQMLIHDESLNNIPDLVPGQTVIRASKDLPWQFLKNDQTYNPT